MIRLVKGRTRLLLASVILAASTGIVRAAVLPEGVDLWFSTSTPTISFSKGIRLLEPGSVLSTSGDVIASNRELLSKFEPASGFLPFFNDKGLDALTIVGSSRRKTIVFSTHKSFYSRALDRQITDGDLINNRGEIVAAHEDLIGAFDPRSAGNYGLDAAFVRSTLGENGPEIWFSTDRSFFSESLGRMVGAGDILSNQGELIASSEDLLGDFDPRSSIDSLGIDSFTAIFDDKGQIADFWFSTNKDFYSKALKRRISSADLLSSDGTVVATPREMMKNFGLVIPICASFELDAATLPRPPYEERRVPEPATMCLLALGAAAGLLRRRA